MYKKDKITTKKTIIKKKPSKKNISILKNEIDVNQILLHSRQVFLFDQIDEQLARDVIKELLALSEISKDPISLWINSRGGFCAEGFAIIDTIKGLKAPIYTFIMGRACSMAGLISVCGDKRVITANSNWMSHEMRAGVSDYVSKALDRTEFWKILQKQIRTILSKHTKLSEKELDQASKGELWLTAEECLKKGIVDYVA